MGNQFNYKRLASFSNVFRQKSKLLLLLALFVTGLVVGTGIWWTMQDSSPVVQQPNNAIATENVPDKKSASNVDDRIRELQSEILSASRSDYQVHVQLAELYAEKGDAKSSIASYEFAKKAVEPNDPQYQKIIADIDAALEKQKQRL